MNLKKQSEKILSNAGIKINGTKPWDIQIKNKDFYNRVLSSGSIGLGESYIEGWWKCHSLDKFFYRILSADIEKKIINKRKLLLPYLKAKIFNLQKKSKAYEIGEKHYDKGNDLYSVMLDKRMVYTCGYWKNTDNLDKAQENKLDMVCRKLGLKKGQKILDIGCGWGSFAKFAAEKYKAEVTGITVSKEQIKLARILCKGLPVKIKLQDYRELKGKFDHIVSLGMFEHVGYKNYRKYMEIADKSLKDNGLFLLHTIGGNKSVRSTDPWINKYIFPDSVLPSIAQIGRSIENLFVMEDWHNFSADYDKTLTAWYWNFNKNWNKIKNNYDERFYRMWEYYLLSCAGLFRARKAQLWQIVLSKKGVKNGYQRIS